MRRKQRGEKHARDVTPGRAAEFNYRHSPAIKASIPSALVVVGGETGVVAVCKAGSVEAGGQPALLLCTR